ncbi:hypothetical protein AAVH_06393 [Aphelenchoides avenae]|nr:hypothetical protein AAVH_06393 [Aphelenchus avenae]
MAAPRGRFANDASANLLKQHLELLARYNALVTSNQTEMLAMIDLLDRTRIEWLKSVQEADRLKGR